MRTEAAGAAIRLALTFAVWFAANVVLNLYNKFVLSHTGFAFPLTLTCSNKAVGWLGSIAVLAFQGGGLPDMSALKQQFKRPMVHAHGIITALNIGLNNWSLVLLSITINQLVKSIVPLPTAGLSVLFEGKTYSWHVYFSMMVLVGGTVLAATGKNAEATPGGLMLALGSVLCAAGWTVVSALLMQRGAAKLDSVSLVFVSSPTSICCLGLMALCLESTRLLAWLHSDPDWVMVPPGPGGGAGAGAGSAGLDGSSHSLASGGGGTGQPHLDAVAAAAAHGAPLPLRRTHASLCVLYLLTGGCMGFGYDLIHNQFLKMTSAVTMSVVGNAKLVVLIGISMATLERAPSPEGIGGVLLALLGCGWYTLHKYSEAKKAEALKRMELSVVEGEEDEEGEMAAAGRAVPKGGGPDPLSTSYQRIGYGYGTPERRHGGPDHANGRASERTRLMDAEDDERA